MMRYTYLHLAWQAPILPPVSSGRTGEGRIVGRVQFGLIVPENPQNPPGRPGYLADVDRLLAAAPEKS